MYQLVFDARQQRRAVLPQKDPAQQAETKLATGFAQVVERRDALVAPTVVTSLLPSGDSLKASRHDEHPTGEIAHRGPAQLDRSDATKINTHRFQMPTMIAANRSSSKLIVMALLRHLE